MKNYNLRTFLFSVVIILSISCYAFLHTIEASNNKLKPSLEVDQIELENMSSQEIMMPDVKIVKTGVEFLKNMFHVSQ